MEIDEFKTSRTFMDLCAIIFWSLAINNNNYFFRFAFQGIYKSCNKGESWDYNIMRIPFSLIMMVMIQFSIFLLMQ